MRATFQRLVAQTENTESYMSRIFAFSAIAATALATVAFLEAVQPAAAKNYEYCRQDYSSGTRQCGFDTMEQCVAMISGRGGSCMRDPFLKETSESFAYARKSKHHRQR
jgi:hypothetical protein